MSYPLSATCSYTYHLQDLQQLPQCESDGTFAAKQCRGDKVLGRLNIDCRHKLLTFELLTMLNGSIMFSGAFAIAMMENEYLDGIGTLILIA